MIGLFNKDLADWNSEGILAFFMLKYVKGVKKYSNIVEIEDKYY
jgi:hypothetical protein